MAQGSSDLVRAVAIERYVRPALRAGKQQFSVAVKDVLQDLVSQGFPAGNTPQVCTALRKETFLRENGIAIDRVDGPPSKMSTTVVFHYRATPRGGGESLKNDNYRQSVSEDPAARAFRLSEKLRGMLKSEMAEHGGGPAFVRWVRSEDEG